MVKNHFVNRILQILIVLFGISFFTFSLTYLSPGDPAEIMLTECGNIPTPELVEQTRAELGLDKPFAEQYFKWASNVAHGEFGKSYSLRVPVLSKIKTALTFMIIISLPLGILAALKVNKWQDYFVRAISFTGLSIPSFWLGLIFLSIFGVMLHWVTVSGGKADFKSLILPAFTLGFAMSAKYIRQVRHTVLEELNKDYVVGARMRGIKESTILIKHVLPNALIPLITLLGLSLGSLLGGTAVIEIIYNFPGMGNLAIKAISYRDYPLVQAYVLLIALIYLVINLIVDFSYKLLDKRVEGAN